MKIPCVERLPFIVIGLSFLQGALTPIQFNNLTMIATAVILGSKFNLTDICRMWLYDRCVSTLSHFLSDAKFCTLEMQNLYILRTLSLYKIEGGYFIIDDTMKHHTKFCKWIHGVSVLFDHALNTNLKAICLVVLYYSDGCIIKFPIKFEIYYKKELEGKKTMPWRRRKEYACKTKYDLAIEMIEWAIKTGFPSCTVLADSWFGIGPFIKKLRKLNLIYVLEIKTSYNVKIPCETPRLTKTGKLAKNQYDLENITQYFDNIQPVAKYGFSYDKEKNKMAKVLYHVKVITGYMNSIPGKHCIIESIDPVKKTAKYLLTNELTWEASKIITSYSYRWVIEEFFRNAKQLSDMEGITIRSEQGITVSLCLVFWIDFLLHYENYKQSTAEELPKEPLTIPSIIRRAQCENMESFIEKVKHDEGFVMRWIEVEKKGIERKRKVYKELVRIDESNEVEVDMAA